MAMTDRAISFNDQSIQENHHCSAVFAGMARDGGINILSSLGTDASREVRRLVILMTLGTDMKRHFQHFQVWRDAPCAPRDFVCSPHGDDDRDSAARRRRHRG